MRVPQLWSLNELMVLQAQRGVSADACPSGLGLVSHALSLINVYTLSTYSGIFIN